MSAAETRAVRESLMALLGATRASGFREITILLGWSAIRLGEELLAELRAPKNF